MLPVLLQLPKSQERPDCALNVFSSHRPTTLPKFPTACQSTVHWSGINALSADEQELDPEDLSLYAVAEHFYLLLPTKLECFQIPPSRTFWHKEKKPTRNWQGDGRQWGGEDPPYWVWSRGEKLSLIMIGIKEAHDKQWSSYHNRRHLLIKKWLWQLNTVSFPKWWGTYDGAFQVFGKYKLLCSFVLMRVTSKMIFSFQGCLQRDIWAPKPWTTHAASKNEMEVFRALVITSSRMKSKKEKLWQASDLIYHTFLAWKILEIFQHAWSCDISSSLNNCWF